MSRAPRFRAVTDAGAVFVVGPTTKTTQCADAATARSLADGFNDAYRLGALAARSQAGALRRAVEDTLKTLELSTPTRARLAGALADWNEGCRA